MWQDDNLVLRSPTGTPPDSANVRTLGTLVHGRHQGGLPAATQAVITEGAEAINAVFGASKSSKTEPATRKSA